MTTILPILIHSIEADGYPDMDALTGRVAFLWDGNIVNGWPLHIDPTDHSSAHTGLWEADSDIGSITPRHGVTHWVEFPRELWEIERNPGPGSWHPRPDEISEVALMLSAAMPPLNSVGGGLSFNPKDVARHVENNLRNMGWTITITAETPEA